MMDFMEGLAKKAGAAALSYYGKDAQLTAMRATVKESITKYDKMLDQLIIQGIREKYPSHSLLTEESGRLEGDPDWLWIVDPLDGTTNFANLNPLFAICLAVIHKGELFAGVVYAPVINELYLAERDNGAYLNHQRIHVSEVPDLGESYMLYCEGGDKDRARTGSLLAQIYPKVLDIRKLGSAGLETAWVAAGKRDAYYATKIEPWDVAPGVLLVREAGGKASDLRNRLWRPETGDLLFSNGKLHPIILQLLRNDQRSRAGRQSGCPLRR